MRVVVLVSREPDWALGIATGWVRAGHDVTAVLCDHAVARARAGHAGAGRLATAVEAGVVMRAHDEALAARGIAGHALAGGVKPVDLDEIAELLADVADKAVWL